VLADRVAEEGGRISTRDVVKVYNACQVVVNLHTAPPDDSGQVDYLNPRTFEVAACAGFQLVDKVSGGEKLFIPGKEMVVFEHPEELPGLVSHYLARPEERFALAQEARRRVLAEHTYYHRMEAVLAACLGRTTGRGHDNQDAADLLLTRLADASL
jgi:spore maturation protein CgeB